VYDWLTQEEETDTSVPDTQPADTDGATAPSEPAESVPVESAPIVTEGEDTASAKKGCRSTLSALLPVLTTVVAIALSKNRERFYGG
jgi:hypothetical protein